MMQGCGCRVQEPLSGSFLGSTYGSRQGCARVKVLPRRTGTLREQSTCTSFARSELVYSPLYQRQRTDTHVCFAGGSRPRKPRLWKTKVRRGSFAKGNKLVEMVLSLSDAKEEIYSALDSWVAWELEFPLVAIKKALKTLQEMAEYKRVIQVSKWMLSKGQGKTMGTYEVLIQAFSAEGRVEEAEVLWEEIFAKHLECVPRVMFGRVLHMYEMHGLDDKAMELFLDMEDLGVKPDRPSVELIADIYGKKGDYQKQENVLRKYPRPTFEWRRYRGKWIRAPLQSVEGDDQVLESNPEYDSDEQNAGSEDVGVGADVEDDDSDEEAVERRKLETGVAEIMFAKQRSHHGGDEREDPLSRRDQPATNSGPGDSSEDVGIGADVEDDDSDVEAVERRQFETGVAAIMFAKQRSHHGGDEREDSLSRRDQPATSSGPGDSTVPLQRVPHH